MKNDKLIIGINASFARKPNTGIGQVTLNFLKELSVLSAGNEKLRQAEFILYLEKDLPEDLKLPKNFQKKVVLPLWRRDDLIRAIWRDRFTLPRKAQKDGCDIFVNLYQSAIILSKNIFHVMLVHDVILQFFPQYLNNSRKKIYWRMTKKAIRSADKIIAVSKRTEKDLIEQLDIPAGNITLNYIDVDEIYKSRVEPEKSQKIMAKYGLKPGYILAGGGYEIRKNVEGAIRAYKHLLGRNKKEHFFQGEFPKLAVYGKLLPELAPLATDAEKLVKELNMTGHVKLLDTVPQENMPAIFQNASMFVYPSLYEGFGMPVLEAMSCSTPVVTSKNSSIPEVGGDSVLYCNPDDTNDIAMVMKNILINQGLRESLKNRGPERAKLFNWDAFTQKVINILGEYSNRL